MEGRSIERVLNNPDETYSDGSKEGEKVSYWISTRF